MSTGSDSDPEWFDAHDSNGLWVHSPHDDVDTSDEPEPAGESPPSRGPAWAHVDGGGDFQLSVSEIAAMYKDDSSCDDAPVPAPAAPAPEHSFQGGGSAGEVASPEPDVVLLNEARQLEDTGELAAAAKLFERATAGCDFAGKPKLIARMAALLQKLEAAAPDLDVGEPLDVAGPAPEGSSILGSAGGMLSDPAADDGTGPDNETFLQVEARAAASEPGSAMVELALPLETAADRFRDHGLSARMAAAGPVPSADEPTLDAPTAWELPQLGATSSIRPGGGGVIPMNPVCRPLHNSTHTCTAHGNSSTAAKLFFCGLSFHRCMPLTSGRC